MILRATARWSASLATVVVLAGCGSSGGSDEPSGSTAPTTPNPTTSTPSTPDADVMSGVTKAYQTFFSPSSTGAQVEAAVQNGDKFADAIEAEGDSQYAGDTGVDITEVTMQSAKVAHVTFSVTLNGAVVLPGASGYAVLDGDTWKLAAKTFCDFLTLEGSAPEQCKDSSLTALPSE